MPFNTSHFPRFSFSFQFPVIVPSSSGADTLQKKKNRQLCTLGDEKIHWLTRFFFFFLLQVRYTYNIRNQCIHVLVAYLKLRKIFFILELIKTYFIATKFNWNELYNNYEYFLKFNAKKIFFLVLFLIKIVFAYTIYCGLTHTKNKKKLKIYICLAW